MADPPKLLDRVLETATTTRTIQELLGHADVKTTMIYTHVLQQTGGRGVRKPDGHAAQREGVDEEGWLTAAYRQSDRPPPRRPSAVAV